MFGAGTSNLRNCLLQGETLFLADFGISIDLSTSSPMSDLGSLGFSGETQIILGTQRHLSIAVLAMYLEMACSADSPGYSGI